MSESCPSYSSVAGVIITGGTADSFTFICRNGGGTSPTPDLLQCINCQFPQGNLVCVCPFFGSASPAFRCIGGGVLALTCNEGSCIVRPSRFALVRKGKAVGRGDDGFLLQGDELAFIFSDEEELNRYQRL